jgi:PTS system mannitol-specific IIC component
MKELNIYFVCDAGMGSSALGASMLQRKLRNSGLNEKVHNCGLNEIPEEIDILISHQMFYKQLKERYPDKLILKVDGFAGEDVYERIVEEIMKETNKKAVLAKEQIRVGCPSVTNVEAIKAVGNLLLDAGYIEEPYIAGMLNRDASLTTYIGNDLAIPHGEYEVKEYVKKTGLAVMIYPDGIDWDGNLVRVVIGIAATNNNHMQILQNIASKLCEMETVDNLVASNDIDYIYQILTEEE